MKPKSTFLTLVFGLVVTLFACQDQSVVAPDDVISPDNLVTMFGKPQCVDPWPTCRNVRTRSTPLTERRPHTRAQLARRCRRSPRGLFVDRCDLEFQEGDLRYACSVRSQDQIHRRGLGLGRL